MSRPTAAVDDGSDSQFTILKPDGSSLTFDTVLEESHAPEVTLTEHPVEDGATYTDHAQRRPDVVTVRAMITESPYSPIDVTSGVKRITEADRFLESCVGELLWLGLVRNGLRTDMMLSGWPKKVTGVRNAVYDLRFRQVKIATASTVEIPARKTSSTGAASAVDAGQQATTEANDAAAADDWSAAYTIGSALGLL